MKPNGQESVEDKVTPPTFTQKGVDITIIVFTKIIRNDNTFYIYSSFFKMQNLRNIPFSKLIITI